MERNEENNKKLEEQIKDEKIKEEKKDDIVRRNNVKKDQKFSRLIKIINLKHSND